MLVVVGLNHHHSPVAVREIYTPGEKSYDLMQQLQAQPEVVEVFLLSTCNRTELYCLCHTGTLPPSDRIRQIWEQTLQIDQAQAKNAPLFSMQGRDALSHLTKVAAGLDAMILGEPQILGQVKNAIREAKTAGFSGAQLQKLLNPMFELVKKVRSSTAIGCSPVSFASATYQLAGQIFANLEKSRIVFLGAGEMIELVCRHFYHNRVRNLTVVNRSLERISSMVSDYGVKAVSLDQLSDILPQADIVVSSTGSPVPLIQHKEVAKALRIRRQQPMFFADLAVPRDVAPEVGELDNAFVYSVDDIHRLISKHQLQRSVAAEEAYRIIEDGLDAMTHQQRVQSLAPVIAQFRTESEKIRIEAVSQARRQLIKGYDPHEVLETLSRQLTQRLIHQPTVGLRNIASTGEDSSLTLAKQLLGIGQDQS